MFGVDPRRKSCNSPVSIAARTSRSDIPLRRTHLCEMACQPNAGVRARGSRATAGLPVRACAALEALALSPAQCVSRGSVGTIAVRGRGQACVVFRDSLDLGIIVLRYVTPCNGSNRAVTLARPGGPASATPAAWCNSPGGIDLQRPGIPSQ
jgi:hypothetical protein